MAEQRPAKRKSQCLDFFSEVSELDLSPENPDVDTDEPDTKVAKTETDISLVTTVTINSENVSNLDQDSEVNKLETCTKVEIDGHCVEGSVSKVDNLDSASTSESQPNITVRFSNQEVADLYKSKFLRFMETFVELELVKSDDPFILAANRDKLLNSQEWVIIDETPESQEVVIVEPKPQDASPSKKRKKKNKNKKEKDLFIVDTNPSVRTHETELRYLSKFVIDNKGETKESEEVRVKAKGLQSCFNCGEGHSLRDCPMPRDHIKIRNARNKFASAQSKSTRYHLEEDQKYGHMKPGVISEELRKALCLRNNELPPYIYRMRILGYPPGWLEEAKFVHSNLNMFDIHGNNVRNSLKKKHGLDPEKIVDYPGFNVPLEKGFRDDFKRYDVPPYSRQFSKETMLNYFEKEFAKEQDDLEACDMEVDDENDVSEVSNLIVIDDDDDSEIKDSKYNVQPRLKTKSPSLVDLEQKKKALLDQLDDSVSSKPGTPSTLCNDDCVIIVEKASEASESDVVSEEHSQSTCENGITSSESQDLLNTTPVNISFNTVKTSFGTPLLKSSSPYSKLPNPDNFMKDVSPVINFENLPNSTGKYEQMSGVIQKVRSTLKKLQGCDT